MTGSAHLDEARNDQSNVMTKLGCASERVDNVERPISPERAAELGCRPDDKMEAALLADKTDPESFTYKGASRLKRSYRTSRNNVTAWWDASQIYGYDERSRHRMRLDPKDPAKLAMVTLAERASPGDRQGYLPEFRAACDKGVLAADCDPLQPEWVGQEAAAFPDNWTLGTSFFQNLFVREHNNVVDALRDKAKKSPQEDSGLRNPEKPDEVISYGRLWDREIFEVARLVVAAEIAKIHTTEWTTQLLYDEPLHLAMNANWSGLFVDQPVASTVTKRLVAALHNSANALEANQFYSALAGGAGIVGLGNSRHWPKFLPSWMTLDFWSLKNPDDVNGGVNHFGSPFNFPGGVHIRLSPAPVGSRSHRISRPQRSQRGSKEGSRHRQLQGQSDGGDPRRRPVELGAEHGPAEAGPADPAQPSGVSSKHRPAAASRHQARRRGPRHHSRPRARRDALQRVPAPDRLARPQKLRRVHGPEPARRARRNAPSNRASSTRCARCTVNTSARRRRS